MVGKKGREGVGTAPKARAIHIHVLVVVIVSIIISSTIILPNSPKSPRETTTRTETMSMPLAYAQETKETTTNANNSNNSTKHYLYGCTQYEYVGFHCDPIQNEFKSNAVLSSYTKLTSATREPAYVQAKFGEGLQISSHSLESLRANIIDAYDSDKFSVYISVKPDNSDEQYMRSYANLVSYKNGVYNSDLHDAGWQIETVPSEEKSVSKVRFTVFNSNGTGFSPPDVTISANKFSEILGSFDGRNVRVFVDGDMKSQTLFNGTYTGNVSRSNFFTIAGDAYCTCELSNGIIDEVRYYNYSLTTAEQVKSINSPQEGDSSNKGLVGYWKFDGDLKDYSQYRNDLFYNTMISSMAFAPDGRLFYNEKNSGNIRIMVNYTVLDAPFASIGKIYVNWDQGLLGLAIDSKFSENHFVYAYYNYKDENSESIYGRVVRFTDSENKGIDETVILDKIPVDSIGFHTGGALSFNPIDEKLYVTVGDGTDPDKAQDLSSLFGKILRIDRDGSIPNDNPFPGSLVYNYGHRNSYGVAFDDKGHGIYTEPGSTLYDKINFSQKGGNYGWPTYQPPDVPPELSKDSVSIKPIRSYWHAITPTQALYYNGDKYPELKGKFIFGSLVGSLYAIKLNEDGTKLLEEWRLKTNIYPSLEAVDVAVSPGGDIYFGSYDIFRLDSLDLSSKVTTMYPVEINATNVEVSSMTYRESREREIALDLNNRTGASNILVRIPHSLIADISERSGNQTAAGTDIPYSVQTESHGNYNLVRLQLSNNAPKDLRFKLGKSITMENIEQPSAAAQPANGYTFLLRPSGCLIATAAFGSELTPQVQYLRNFRETYILSTESGSAFMNAFNAIYYSFSPQVADYERGHPWLQQTVKSALYPLFGILSLSASVHTSVGGGEAGSLAAGAVASIMIGAIYLSPVTALAWPVQKRFKSAAKISLIVAAASLAVAIFGILLLNNQVVLMVSTSLLVLSLVSFSALLTVNMVRRAIHRLLGRK